MKRGPSASKRRQVLRIPGWYYALLVGVAVVGGILIALSVRRPSIQTDNVTAEGDYIKGDPNAPVTIIEWGSFQ